MAKNKNPTALFDVIHAAKKPPKSSPSASIPAPRWWGKDKKPLKKTAEETTENVGKQKSWLLAAKQSVGMGAASAVEPIAPEVESVPSLPAVQPSSVGPMEPVASLAPFNGTEATEMIADEPAAPKGRFMDRFRSRAAATVSESTNGSDYDDSDDAPLPVFYSTAGDPKPDAVVVPLRREREKMVSLDPIRGDIVLNLSYGGAVAAGFIILVALAIAFVAGTHSQVASTDSSDLPKADSAPMHVASLTSSPSAAGMMAAVNPGIAPSTGNQTPVRPSDPYPVYKPEVLNVTPHTAHQLPEVPASESTALPITAKREIGVIYMVIQSYPDQDMAQKACDFVNRSGIPCTLVQGLSGWAPRDWYSVVGLKPYKKHDPALDPDEHTLSILGTKFSNKIYNQYQPQGYTWRTDSDGQ